MARAGAPCAPSGQVGRWPATRSPPLRSCRHGSRQPGSGPGTVSQAAARDGLAGCGFVLT